MKNLLFVLSILIAWPAMAKITNPMDEIPLSDLDGGPMETGNISYRTKNVTCKNEMNPHVILYKDQKDSEGQSLGTKFVKVCKAQYRNSVTECVQDNTIVSVGCGAEVKRRYGLDKGKTEFVEEISEDEVFIEQENLKPPYAIP